VVRSSFPAQRRLFMSNSRSVTHILFDLDEAGYRINLSPSTRRPDSRAPNCRAPHGSGGLERQGSNLGLRRSHLTFLPPRPCVSFPLTPAVFGRVRATVVCSHHQACLFVYSPKSSDSAARTRAGPASGRKSLSTGTYWYLLVHTTFLCASRRQGPLA
jgi:hypothetical protein